MVPSWRATAGYSVKLDLRGSRRTISCPSVRRRAVDGSRLAVGSAFVDTNMIVGHLTGDPRAKAERATGFLTSEGDLLLADLVVAGYHGSIAGTGGADRLAPGEETELCVFFDTVAIRPEDGYALAPGTYEVRARLNLHEWDRDSESYRTAARLTPPARLEIVAAP